MKQLGDLTQIHGWDIEPVDCITGGSPCQDLSVAGKRAGLAGERSGLFMEQIRIVKEMRDRDRADGRAGIAIRPRFMVWENVPGAFSSNKGQDFQAVLTEIIRIIEPEAPDVPMPEKGKWPKSGCLYDDMGRWSIAWRLHNAQFWGVPQRRKRIALVADFGGHAAPEILFERKGLSGDFAESGAAGEETAAGAGGGTASAVAGLTNRGYFCGDIAETVRAESHGAVPMVAAYNRHAICAGFKPHAGAGAGSIGYAQEKAPTLDTGKPMAVYDARGNGDGKTVCTLTGDHQSRVTDYTVVVMATGQAGAEITRDTATTLNCNHEQPIIARALRGSGNDPQREDMATYPVTDGLVRRLTPLECERLQGYPDGWTILPPVADMSDCEYEFWKQVLMETAVREGKARKNEDGELEIWRSFEVLNDDDEIEVVWENTHKPYKHKTKKQTVKWYNKSFTSDTDSARYKALGNSIALPFWFWLLRRISAQYERPATLGSLFDGIGGFPLCWERCNGSGTARWASEIEAFPMAVTKYHFPEREEE